MTDDRKTHYKMERDTAGDWGIRSKSPEFHTAMLAAGFTASRSNGTFFPFSGGTDEDRDDRQRLADRKAKHLG